MLECKRCHLTGVPDHHFNYRVCPFCESYFLCLTLAQEHYLKCDQRKSHIEKSVEKKIRIEDEDQQQQGGSRGNLEEERVSFEPFQKQRTRKCFKELQRYEYYYYFFPPSLFTLLYCRYFDYKYISDTPDLHRFMSEAKNILKNNILEYFEEHGQLKFCWPFRTRWRRKDGTSFVHVFRSK